MAHLGKVVLFFSQGLRTGSGGKATNQEDQGHGVPPPSPPPPAPPRAHQPLFKEPPVQRTFLGDYNPQHCLQTPP